MIGGNLNANFQTKSGNTRNEIGEKVPTWETLHTLTGWLDLSSGDSKYTSYSAKIQESTHVFVCDYVVLNANIRAENSRMLIKNHVYDVMLIDNPMELNQQLEIYLKYTGELNG